MLKKIVAYYTRKHKNKKNQFLIMIWNCYHIYFLKYWIYKKVITLSKIQISSKIILKKGHIFEQL
jgi:hypothetical protein